MNRSGVIAVCALLGACGPGRAGPAGGAAPSGQTSVPTFVGAVWLSIDASAAPGTIRIFLPDGTLVMDSCGETYRLARWRSIDERRIEWQEDSARIEAAITQPAADQLELRLQLAREVKHESYRLARVPSVCPDLPR